MPINVSGDPRRINGYRVRSRSGRGTIGQVPAAVPAAAAAYTVHMTIEPEAGVTGDPLVLEMLAKHGFAVKPVDGTPRMAISIRRVSAASVEEAAKLGREAALRLVPENGYRLSKPAAVAEEARPVAG